ncbi:MAG: DNA-3-methyladenine glycosylase I [Acidimicrobiales bacterium]
MVATQEGTDSTVRCPWATGPWLTPYHDDEWGVALHDDRRLFELLVLEGAQAGLSWLTVLKRRDAYRRAFGGFDPAHVAGFGEAKVRALMSDPGLIRHRMKLESAVANAAGILRLRDDLGSFDAYLWDWVGGVPVRNSWRRSTQVPAQTPLSAALAKDLAGRGFRFVGPITCYSFLQSAGLVVDHLVECFRYEAPSGG